MTISPPIAAIAIMAVLLSPPELLDKVVGDGLDVGSVGELSDCDAWNGFVVEDGRTSGRPRLVMMIHIEHNANRD